MTFVFVFLPKVEFHFRRHFPLGLRPKMKSAFLVGLYIKLFQIIPYLNDFLTSNNPVSRQPVGALKISFTLHFWHKSHILHHHHRRRRVVRWTVAPVHDPWWSHISTAYIAVERWHPPEPCWAMQTLRGRPGGLLQLTIGFFPSYVSTIRRRASWLCWYSRVYSVYACNMAKQR